MGRDEQARQVKSLIKSVISSALLDDNTCPYCAGLDGQEWPVDEVDWDNQPPYGDCEGEDRCRCVWVYVFKDEGPAELPKVPEFVPAPIETIGNVPKGAKIRIEHEYQKLPPGSQKGIKSIKMYESIGPVGTYDHGKFQVGGQYKRSTGTLDLYDAKGYAGYGGEQRTKWMLGHEAGHAAEASVSPAKWNSFVASTELEGGISDYARKWLASNPVYGVTENFADAHKVFVIGGTELKNFAKYYPETHRAFSKIWVDDLGGAL